MPFGKWWPVKPSAKQAAQLVKADVGRLTSKDVFPLSLAGMKGNVFI